MAAGEGNAVQTTTDDSRQGPGSPGTTSEAEVAFYGVADTSDACSEASVTQALRRCSPLIAPVTLSTLPAPQEEILHEGDFIGSKHERFGFQDGLGKARKRRCGKDQP